MTSLRLRAVLNAGFKNVEARHAEPAVAERRDWPLTRYGSGRQPQALYANHPRKRPEKDAGPQTCTTRWM